MQGIDPEGQSAQQTRVTTSQNAATSNLGYPIAEPLTRQLPPLAFLLRKSALYARTASAETKQTIVVDVLGGGDCFPKLRALDLTWEQFEADGQIRRSKSSMCWTENRRMLDCATPGGTLEATATGRSGRVFGSAKMPPYRDERQA